MNRSDLHELHYITRIGNVKSIETHGILSHRKAKELEHVSVASSIIQERRVSKSIPQGLPLHDYANLYIYARNPMLFKRKNQHASLCVLRVSTDVLDLPDVVVTDRNASSDYARFVPAPDGLQIVDHDLVFAQYWTHDDTIEEWRHKSIKCAEVLVPQSIDSSFIMGAYVSCRDALTAFNATGVSIPVCINRRLFFQR